MVQGPSVAGPGQMNNTFSRLYKGLPSHTMIYYIISFWMIDAWDSSPQDTFVISFDSQPVTTGWTFNTNQFSTDLCGNTYNDGKVKAYGRLLHTNTSLTVSVMTLLDALSDNESLGFRDISILFTSPSPVYSSSICGMASYTLPSHACTCTAGKHYVNGTCVACNALCDACFGSSAAECFKCTLGSSYNGVACVPCDANCGTCSGTNQSYCLACKTGYYLTDNNTCATSCPSPYEAISTQGIIHCIKPIIPAASTVTNVLSSINSVSSTIYNNNQAQRFSSIENIAIKIVSAGNTMLSISLVASRIFGFNNPMFGSLLLIKMLPYIRYMEINYPQNLQRMLDNIDNTITGFSFGLGTSFNMKKAFVKYQLPAKFDLYEFHSSFFVNYWKTFTGLCFMLGVIVMIDVATRFTKSK